MERKNLQIEINEDLSVRLTELAKDMGMTEDEVVQQILEWYFEDQE
jgi:predicted DNA-binding protein